LDMGLWCIAFILLRYIPSILNLTRTFIKKGHWILWNAFYVSIEMIMWFLSLLLFMCCITFIDLGMLNHLYILRMKLTWSPFWYDVEFSFFRMLIRIFASKFIDEIGLQFCFLFYICLVWGEVWYWLRRMIIVVFPLLLFHGIFSGVFILAFFFKV
jgi:hypothetical protein